MKDDVVYILRTCASDGGSSNRFKYPLLVGTTVVCHDWDPDPSRECGGGLHGLRNGIGNSSLIPDDVGRWWQVYKCCAEDVLPTNGGKARWLTGTLVYSAQNNGTTTARDGAIEFLVSAGCPRVGIVFDVVVSGDRGQSTSGDWGQSTSGDRGQSTSGYRGKVATGPYGGLSARWHDAKIGRYRIRCGEVGCGDGSDGLLKSYTWYTVSIDGKWVEGKPVCIHNSTQS